METINQTFKDYKDRFKQVFEAMLPMFLLQIIPLAIIFAALFAVDSLDLPQQTWLIIEIVGAAVILVSVLLMLLVYSPASFRVFQQREEGTILTLNQAAGIQRKTVWPWVKFCLSFLVFALMYWVIIFGPMVVIISALIFFHTAINVVIGIIGGLVALALTVYLALIHAPKLIYACNIFLSSKNMGPWDSMKESIRLVKAHRAEAWGTFGGLFIISLIGMFAQLLISFVSGPKEFLASMQNSITYEPALYYTIISGTTGAIINIFFSCALMYIYLAKKYQEIRVLDEHAAIQSVAPIDPIQ
ncbi:MAG: hypothetical protein RJB39_578 [Candidatus Parcubacteria bacterium]|jgi:hypothetical protein